VIQFREEEELGDGSIWGGKSLWELYKLGFFI